jgi:methylase of polypeptide subunit release factors
VSHLVRLLRGAEGLPAELRVLDLCTGTGCIPLLFAHEFYTNTDQECETDLRVLGVDVSSKALKLAEHNLKRTTRTSLKETPPKQKANINFLSADILCDPFADQVPGSPRPLKSALNLSRHPRFWDILISNPPYISPKEYWKTTTRSVRGYEPKLALVPQPHAGLDDVGQGDMFYAPLLDIAADIEAKIVLLEVADLAQALRVARQAQDTGWFDGVEIWRDQPDTVEQASDEKTAAEPQEFPIVGQGNARTVLCYRGPGTQWLQKQPLRPPLAAHASSPTAQSHSLEPTFDFQPVKGAQGRYRVNWSP